MPIQISEDRKFERVCPLEPLVKSSAIQPNSDHSDRVNGVAQILHRLLLHLSLIHI